MKTLIIDSSDSKELTVGLKIGYKEYFLKQKTDSRKAQMILNLIEKILKKHSLRLEDIEGIDVNTGPGSFTGIRVGVSVANSLSFILRIPINGKKPPAIVEPVYK